MKGILMLCLALLTLAATAEEQRGYTRRTRTGGSSTTSPRTASGKTGGSWRLMVRQQAARQTAVCDP